MRNLLITFFVVLLSQSGCNDNDSLPTDTTPISNTPSQGLVAYYSFNGTSEDGSGNGNHGTSSGTTLTDNRLGVSGKAFAFDGVSSSITVPTLTTLNQLTQELTIGVWFRTPPFQSPSAGYSAGILLSKRDYTQPNYPIHFNLQIDNNSVVFFCQMGNDPFEQYRPVQNIYWMIADSAWHFLAITHSYTDTSKTEIYLDGLRIPGYWTGSSAPAVGPAHVGASYLVVGKQVISGGEWPFRGAIDDLRIYNRILTSDELLILRTTDD